MFLVLHEYAYYIWFRFAYAFTFFTSILHTLLFKHRLKTWHRWLFIYATLILNLSIIYMYFAKEFIIYLKYLLFAGAGYVIAACAYEMTRLVGFDQYRFDRY